MSKTHLTFLVFLGFIALYLLVLFIATIIATPMFVKDYNDDLDYALMANVIQFIVMALLIGEKVSKWIN